MAIPDSSDVSLPNTEELELHGELSWDEIDSESLAAILPTHMYPDAPETDSEDKGYSLVRQFMDSAKNQPGVAFGFRAGTGVSPEQFIIKWEDDKFYVGTNENLEAFAAIDGNDGDGDEDDLDPYPVFNATADEKPEKKTKVVIVKLMGEAVIEGTVFDLLGEKRDLTEADADAIALLLLN